MQLEALKIFCDVVRWSSFSRGAAENGISQSSASQAVHQLEVRLGVKLIDRSKRPLVLTRQGKVYYEGCKELVERYMELENRVKALDDEETVVGTVGVAAIYSVGMHHMSQYIKIFEERFPEANVRLEYLHPSRVVERVTGGEAELGLMSYPRKWPELDVIPWRDEVMVLAVHPSHRFASLGTVDIRGAGGEPFVAFDADLSIRRRDRPLPAPSRCAGRDRARVRQHREHQAGRRDPLGHLDPARALPGPRGTRGTLVAVRIGGQDPEDRLTRPLAIIHRRHDNLDLAAAKFLELLTAIGVEVDHPRTAGPARRMPAATSLEILPALADSDQADSRSGRVLASRRMIGGTESKAGLRRWTGPATRNRHRALDNEPFRAGSLCLSGRGRLHSPVRQKP